LGEADSLLCQQIERGSSNSVVPIAVNVVGTQSIDSNEKNARTGYLVGFGLVGGDGTSSQKAAEEDKKDPHSIERITARVSDSFSASPSP
jgi:hypothetical protein